MAEVPSERVMAKASKQAAYTATGDHATPISFEDIGRYPGRACVGRMGAPTSPSFSPCERLASLVACLGPLRGS